MQHTVGRRERIARLAIGSGAAAAAVFAPVKWPWRLALGAVAGLGIFTGTTQFCPAERVLGLNYYVEPQP
ncbi:MAG: DUF2892 domain-containing protein [Acidobacteria bacterium]|nr:DUF2892 domain-containing protein [Acidobacteriota bacterium]